MRGETRSQHYGSCQVRRSAAPAGGTALSADGGTEEERGVGQPAELTFHIPAPLHPAALFLGRGAADCNVCMKCGAEAGPAALRAAFTLRQRTKRGRGVGGKGCGTAGLLHARPLAIPQLSMLATTSADVPQGLPAEAAGPALSKRPRREVKRRVTRLRRSAFPQRPPPLHRRRRRRKGRRDSGDNSFATSYAAQSGQRRAPPPRAAPGRRGPQRRGRKKSTHRPACDVARRLPRLSARRFLPPPPLQRTKK